MENSEKIENDYPHNQQNPGPSKPAVEEKNDRPAGNTIKWVIIVAVIVLLIVMFIYNY